MKKWSYELNHPDDQLFPGCLKLGVYFVAEVHKTAAYATDEKSFELMMQRMVKALNRELPGGKPRRHDIRKTKVVVEG